MNATHLHILQHALGVGGHGDKPAYRNHFVTSPGSTDHAPCVELVAAGLMVQHPPSALTGGADLFAVTDAGRAYVLEHSPKRPALTRAQARYEAWIREDCGLRFGEWLRRGGGRHVRAVR